MRYILVLALLWPVYAYSEPFTDSQSRLLDLAYRVGKPYGLESTLQAVMLQETHAGELGKIGDRHLPIGTRSYGVTQVRVGTARWMLNLYPKVKRQYFGDRKDIYTEEIVSKLLTDDEFTLRISVLYLVYLRKRTRSWASMVEAYNTGLGGIGNNPAYVNKVRYWIRELR